MKAQLLVQLCLFHLTIQSLPPSTLPERFRVAYIADVSVDGLLDGLSKEVMELIVAEGAELVVISGDLTYVYEYGLRFGTPDFLVNQTGPEVFMQQLDDILGEDIPVFAVPGNADEKEWESFDLGTPNTTGLRERLWERLERTGVSEHCEGPEFGINSICYFNGILFVLSGIGSSVGSTNSTEQLQYIEDVLEEYDGVTKWKVCVFHKVQHLFQTSSKSDELPEGFRAYEICREHGAAIHTAHAHNYARTKNMETYSETPKLFALEARGGDNIRQPLVLRKGVNYNVLNGLGGFNIVAHEDGLEQNEWWATALALNSDPPVQHGAVFCEYFTNRQSHDELRDDLANCYFKQIDGTVRDSWYLKSELRSQSRTA